MDLLRRICMTGSVRAEEADGRVARGLLARGLVRENGEHLVPSEAGRKYREHPARHRRRRRAGDNGARSARAEAVHRALDAIERALPREAEVQVGQIFAYAEDVVAGFRQWARRLEKSAGKSDGVP